MRDEHGHLVQMNGMSGPLLMGRGIPIAMVPVLPVVNGNETAAVSIPPVPAPAPPPAPALGNGARECKYEDKNRIYSPQQNSQNKNVNRKLPTNGAHRMTKTKLGSENRHYRGSYIWYFYCRLCILSKWD
ncbi:uncharacterized protein TNCT_517431 [Trichonephila clavata]|uniref:Uncharacterized protein n=1 Tax=Trichonephila clavata TaxID=2740835 RepID=A0A8X6HPV9_TRICU|nr:uncharacterized protein TNCT_517431 [Trichonephila clavata]